MPAWHAGGTGRGRRSRGDVPAGLDRLWVDTLAQETVSKTAPSTPSGLSDRFGDNVKSGWRDDIRMRNVESNGWGGDQTSLFRELITFSMLRESGRNVCSPGPASAPTVSSRRPNESSKSNFGAGASPSMRFAIPSSVLAN